MNAFLNPLATAFTQEEHRLLQECIHCGFCLPVCPTYKINGKEMDSPRGRLYLVEAAVNGHIDLSDPFFEHTDLCLVCRACESACPSGVRFGNLMERTRAMILPHRRRNRLSGLVEAVVMKNLIPSHKALSVLFGLIWLYQHLGLHWLATHTPANILIPRKLRLLQDMLSPVPAQRFGRGATLEFPAVGPRRGKVALFTGCVMDHLFPDVHRATVRLLRWTGYDVIVPGNQTCCGALHIHAGHEKPAVQLAGTNLKVLDDPAVDAVIVNAAGCGAHLKAYPRLLGGRSDRFAAKVRDLTEFLAGQKLLPPAGSLDLKVVYDDPCHLIHAQGISGEPRSLIQLIPGLTLLALPEADSCCGSAGTYSIDRVGMSLEVLERKMRFVEKTGAHVLLTANPGCQIQLEWGVRRHNLRMEVLHLAQLLDRAYSADDSYARMGREKPLLNRE